MAHKKMLHRIQADDRGGESSLQSRSGEEVDAKMKEAAN
jgi:hypothetical protein